MAYLRLPWTLLFPQEAAGQLLKEYQANFDKYMRPQCPSQLTAPVLHRVLEYEPIQAYIYGGKGVGSQGDGTAQFLAKTEDDQNKIVEIITKDLGMTCLTLTLGAARTVLKAVIPVAGYQSDLFPANVTGAGMFPIVDKDGLCKPSILLLVEEALCAGIEEVIIIIHPEDMDVYSRLFHRKPSIEKFNRSVCYPALAIHYINHSTIFSRSWQKSPALVEFIQTPWSCTACRKRNLMGSVMGSGFKVEASMDFNRILVSPMFFS